MTREDEDRILHGLYYLRESIDEDMRFSGQQLLWPAMHPLHEGDAWMKDGQPQSLDTATFQDEILGKLTTAKLDLPLRYLQHRRLITLAKRAENVYSVSVTFAGADRAIRLHTRRGRLDLWYRERKDGVLGAVATVLIAFITAVITVLVLNWMLR
jgi:hypothetical protein